MAHYNFIQWNPFKPQSNTKKKMHEVHKENHILKLNIL